MLIIGRSFHTMESSSTLRLKFKYGGYFKNHGDAKRKYCLGRQKTMVIDIDFYNLKTLEEDLSQFFSWDINQIPKYWCIIRGVEPREFVEIITDSNLLNELDMCKEDKTCEIYVVLDDVTPIAVQGGLEKANEGTRYGLRKQSYQVHQIEGSSCDPIETEPRIINEMQQADEDESDEDYVGSDEDSVSTGVDEDMEVESEKSYHSLYNSSDSDDDKHVDTFKGVIYEVDEENPIIEVGRKFEDVYHYRRCLQHFAILKEFSITYIKSDQRRVTARCASEDCSWRVHASRLSEENVFQIKTM